MLCSFSYGPVFKGQGTLEDGTDILSETSVISQQSEGLKANSLLKDPRRYVF
jgi:hypothetical protein